MLPQISLSGKVVADSELRFSAQGKPVLNFRVAANKAFFNAETKQWEKEQTCYLTVVWWAPMAETMAPHIAKGATVVVMGELQQEEWTDRTGQKRHEYKLIARSVGVIHRGQDQPQHGQQFGQQYAPPINNNNSGGVPWGTPPEADDQPPF